MQIKNGSLKVISDLDAIDKIVVLVGWPDNSFTSLSCENHRQDLFLMIDSLENPYIIKSFFANDIDSYADSESLKPVNPIEYFGEREYSKQEND